MILCSEPRLPYYEQEKFTNNVNVLPFLCSVVKIGGTFTYIEKQKRFFIMYLALFLSTFVLVVFFQFIFQLQRYGKNLHLFVFLLTSSRHGTITDMYCKRIGIYEALKQKTILYLLPPNKRNAGRLESRPASGKNW